MALSLSLLFLMPILWPLRQPFSPNSNRPTLYPIALVNPMSISRTSKKLTCFLHSQPELAIEVVDHRSATYTGNRRVNHLRGCPTFINILRQAWPIRPNALV